MVADCGATCAKYLLCLFNFVFFVTGSAILCIGIWLAVDMNSFIQFTRFSTLNEGVQIGNEAKGIIRELTEPTVIEQGAYILIAAGAFIFIISFLGYCGPVKESRVLLTAYGIFLVVILLLQVAAIVLAAVYKQHAEKHTQDFFTHTLRKYYTTKEHRDGVTLVWDLTMAKLHCCGVNGYDDFKLSEEFVKYGGETGQVVPETCCKLKDYSEGSQLFVPADHNCIRAPTITNSYMNRGCFPTIYDWIVEHLNIVIGVTVGIVGVQVLATIFAFCLCRAVGIERDYRYKY